MDLLLLLAALNAPAPLFQDDFSHEGLREWKSVIPAFEVRDGVLHAHQARADHGAVGRVHRPMRDVAAEFRFRLEGSTSFNAVFDDQAHKGSHAGHILRVAFTPGRITLGDDKEGVMRNDIYELRRTPEGKQKSAELLKGRSASVAVKLEQERWHSVRIEVKGDLLRVFLDGKPAGELRSPGVAHPTKTSFHFTVNGKGMSFDDVRLTAL